MSYMAMGASSATGFGNDVGVSPLLLSKMQAIVAASQTKTTDPRLVAMFDQRETVAPVQEDAFVTSEEVPTVSVCKKFYQDFDPQTGGCKMNTTGWIVVAAGAAVVLGTVGYIATR